MQRQENGNFDWLTPWLATCSSPLYCPRANRRNKKFFFARIKPSNKVYSNTVYIRIQGPWVSSLRENVPINTDIDINIFKNGHISFKMPLSILISISSRMTRANTQWYSFILWASTSLHHNKGLSQTTVFQIKGIRDARSTADFRILFEILKF